MDNALDTYGYILREHLSNCFSEKPIVNPAELNQEKFKVKGVFIASIIFMKNNLPIDGCKIVSSTNYWLRTSFANSNLDVQSETLGTSNQEFAVIESPV